MKQFSESCSQNQEPILEVLKKVFTGPGIVLEIGSGTGQHAAYFPAFLPRLTWQPSDRVENLSSIRAWCTESGLANVNEPLELDVTQALWPISEADFVFSANTVHIMAWPMVHALFKKLGETVAMGGAFCLYGPFNYGGQFSSESNARFDVWLKGRDPESGIKGFEELDTLATEAGFVLKRDFEMPANNRILYWEKIDRPAL